jgi:hypothetical protein
MDKKDYEFLLESWEKLAQQLQEINTSLSELVAAQAQTILKLQGVIKE